MFPSGKRATSLVGSLPRGQARALPIIAVLVALAAPVSPDIRVAESDPVTVDGTTVRARAVWCDPGTSYTVRGRDLYERLLPPPCVVVVIAGRVGAAGKERNGPYYVDCTDGSKSWRVVLPGAGRYLVIRGRLVRPGRIEAVGLEVLE